MDAKGFDSSLRGWGRAAALIALGACAIGLGIANRAHAVDPLPAVQADFMWTPAVAIVGQTVTYESTSRATGLANIVEEYRWDLDGDTSNGYETGWRSNPVATTSYAVRGAVDVRLQVQDTVGNRSTVKKTVMVAGQAPVPSFTISPAAPLTGQPVLFTSTASDPDDDAIASLAWDLNGDGNFDNGNGPTALRTFDAPGVYVIGLRATDEEGAVSFYSEALSVAPLPLVATLKPGLALRLLSPFPVVRISGRISRRGTRLKLLAVDAPAGSTVTVRCRGRGCPFRKQTRAAGAGGRNANAAKRVRLRRLERLLRPGTIVRISVTRKNTIGKYTAFKIRRGKAPRRTDLCLMPSSNRPVSCPAA